MYYLIRFKTIQADLFHSLLPAENPTKNLSYIPPKVPGEKNTADYIWHQKTFWASPEDTASVFKFSLPKSLSSIWSPSQEVPLKEGCLWVQSKSHTATMSQMELTGDGASCAEHNLKLLTESWLHSKAGNWKLVKLYPTIWSEVLKLLRGDM